MRRFAPITMPETGDHDGARWLITMGEIRNFLSEGMAIVFATPNMDEAARCHRVGLLFEGRLLEEGQPSEMLRAFQHPVFRVRGERAKVVAAIERNPDVLACTPAGAELRVVVRRAREQGVRSLLSALGAQTSTATATFEDLFLTRVRERLETRHAVKSVS